VSVEQQRAVKENLEALKLLKTAPYNPRFPNQRQDNYCWASYVQYFKCVKEKDETDPECKKYRFYYLEMCPSSWIEQWDAQREQGIFPGQVYWGAKLGGGEN
jgi:cytochrome c oxidase subunit 6b